MQNASLDWSVETSTARSRATLFWSAGLTFCILLTALVSSVALLVFAIRSIDGNQAAYEAKLAQRNVHQSLNRVARDMVSATTWDDAYVRSHGAVDYPWIEREWGVYFHGYFNHDLTVALDGDDHAFYAAYKGQTVSTAPYAGFSAAARPLIDQVRREAAAKRFLPGGRRAVGLPATARATGIVPWNGGLYITGVTNVMPETTGVALSPEPDVIVISAKAMGGAFMDGMQETLALNGLELQPAADAAPGDRFKSIDLTGATGKPVGRLVWTPGEPGRGILIRFSLLIVAGLIVLGAASAGLMMRVRSMVSRLLDKDRALRVAMADLTKTRDAAEAANSAKSAFVANISHEIRTPLNGLIGMTQVMTAYPLDPQQEERLKVVHDSAQTLLALLNDVLDMAKIEAGRMEIVPAPTDLRELVDNVCQPFAEMAAAKGLAFEIAFDPQVDGARLCDGLRVRQVLANLASNAVKFTDRGRIRMVVRPILDGVRFHCIDTGIGMPAEKLPNLFSKFSQLDGSDTRRASGAGLGLALSRELAQRMGGKLSAQSTQGKGSVFTFDLPAKPAQPQSHAQVSAVVQAVTASDGRPLRVLVAEDNLVNRMVLEALLAPRGVDLTLAEDGLEAVRLFKDGEFDLVLMDIQMPLMSGIDATRAIRAFETGRGRPATPILAVTANVLSHQREAYRAVGMDGCVAKPIEAARLHQAIDDVLAGETIAPDTIAAAWDDQTAAPEDQEFKKAG